MNVTVRRGDCLWSIAQAHHVSLKALIAANPQIKNPSLIFAGQQVHMPGATKDTFEAPKTSPSSSSSTSHGDPKSFFKTQFRSKYNPTGPLRSNNCGPASLAMAVDAFGLEPKGLEPEQSIDRVRKLMTGNTDDSDPTSDAERERGARRAGLHAEHLNGPGSIDAQLAKGHMITLTGRPIGAYRTAFPHYSDFTGFHSILVVGKTKDGRYIVNDPLSHYGPRTMTRAQLSAFWSHGGGSGTAVWR